MKASEYYLKKWWPEATLMTTNIGNTGYFIRYGDYNDYSYGFITKKHIAKILTYYETNERKIKLITLQILNE